MTTKTNTAKKITTDDKKAKANAFSAKLKALIEKNKAADKASEKKVTVEKKEKTGAKILDLKSKLKKKDESKPQPRTTLLKDKKERARCNGVGVDAVIGDGDAAGLFVTVVGDNRVEMYWEDRADAIACALDFANHIRETAKKLAEREAD